jgi:O-antigen ligase
VYLLATADSRRAVVVALLSCAIIGVAGLVGATPLTMLALTAIAALAVASPTGTLAATIALLPYFYRPIGIGGQQFAASELLLFLTAFGTVVQHLFFTCTYRERVREATHRLVDVVTSPIVIAASLLVLLGLILVARPFDPAHRAESLREWRWTLLEPALLVALLVWHRRDRWLAELVALALLGGGAVASLYALADLALGGGVSVAGVTRIAGPYPHPNALALMTARIAAFGFAWAVLEARYRRVLVPLVVVCGLAVAATFSRGAMLAGFVALALVLINADSRVRLASAGGSVVALLAAVVVARDRMLDLFGGGSGSLRIDIWSSAMQMIGDRPVIGYGPDQFLYAYLPRYVRPTAWGERFTSHAHNFVLDFWVRLGIIGAAFAVVAALICVVAMARHVREPSESRILGQAALVALVATLAHGMVDNAFFSHDLAMSCWLLAWLAFGVGTEVAGNEGGVDIARPGFGRGRVHRFASLR